MKKSAILGVMAPLMAVATISALAPPAAAKCIRSVEHGVWKNIDPDSWTITRLELKHVCKDSSYDGEYTQSGPSWYVEPFGNCGRYECSWGRVGAEQSLRDYKRRGYPDQKPEERIPFDVRPIFSTFDWEGFRRYLYIHMSPEEEGLLILRVYSEFPDGKYEMEDIAFRKDSTGEPLKGRAFTLIEK